MNRIAFIVHILLTCVFAVSPLSLPLFAAGSYGTAIDAPMYQLPKMPVPRVETLFPEGATELWLRALARPEADLKCKAAEAIATAHREGFKGFEETIDPLLALLDQPDAHPRVRLTVAETLVVLDARRAAASFLRHAQTGSNEMRERVEPALARWDHRPARAMWLSRLRTPGTPQRNLVLAIQCLTTVREEQAIGRLRAIVQGARIAGPMRLEAARALAVLQTIGLEAEAERLSLDASPRGLVPRLLAASLLRRHSGAETVRLLQRLARDSEPAVAAPAAERLLEIDPELLVPTVEHLLASPDANLRSFGIDVLRRRPSAKHIHLLAARLDDADLEVRRKARRHLHELAGDRKWRDHVLTEAMAQLQTRQWRGLEQAMLLLTQLDHNAAAGRMVELLVFERPEVPITAAWGLRRLAVAETLPKVVAHIEQQLKQPPTPKSPLLGIHDHVLSQLNQLLGQQKYRPADGVLRRFIPKSMNTKTGPESRTAALWALGLIHEGRSEGTLTAAVEGRLNDSVSMPPEDVRVRYMSAITLGRLKAPQAVDSLRRYYAGEATDDLINNACGWAVQQITGEVMPPPKTIRKARHDWFLLPLKRE